MEALPQGAWAQGHKTSGEAWSRVLTTYFLPRLFPGPMVPEILTASSKRLPCFLSGLSSILPLLIPRSFTGCPQVPGSVLGTRNTAVTCAGIGLSSRAL